MMPIEKIIKNLVLPELIQRYQVPARIFFDGDYLTAQSGFQSPNIIILCKKNIRDMGAAIQCVCHEYRHLLQEYRAKQDKRLRDILSFYLTECHEFYDHDQSVLGRRIYETCPLELDARAFAENFGTVDKDHMTLYIPVEEFREAYRDSPETLVRMIQDYQERYQARTS